MALTNPSGSKVIRVSSGSPSAGNTIIYNSSNQPNYSNPGFASGSYFGSFAGSLTANRTYTFPDLSGTIALNSTDYLFKFNSGNVSLRNAGDTSDLNFTANLINLTGNSLTLNSDGASGADRAITISRPLTGMTANYELTLPSSLGSTGQALILTNNTGQLGWGSGSGGATTDYPGLTRIIYKDSNWGLTYGYSTTQLYWRSRESGGGETSTGKINIGYLRIRNWLYIPLCGGGNTNGNLKLLKIIRNSDNTVLGSYTLGSLISINSDTLVIAAINTSSFADTIAYISIEDNDSGTGWAWVGFEPEKAIVSD